MCMSVRVCVCLCVSVCVVKMHSLFLFPSKLMGPIAKLRLDISAKEIITPETVISFKKFFLANSFGKKLI